MKVGFAFKIIWYQVDCHIAKIECAFGLALHLTTPTGSRLRPVCITRRLLGWPSDFVLHTLGGIRKSYKNHTEIFEAPNHPTGPTGPTSLSVPYLAAQRLMWSMFERCQRNFDTSWDLHLTHQLPTNALEFFKKNVHSYHQPLNKQIGGRKPCNHLGCAHVVNPSWPYNSTIGEHEP